MRLKPKCGYWDVTHYSYGGCFHRAGAMGIQLEKVEVFSTYADGTPKEYKAKFDAGNRELVALASHVETVGGVS